MDANGREFLGGQLRNARKTRKGGGLFLGGNVQRSTLNVQRTFGCTWSTPGRTLCERRTSAGSHPCRDHCRNRCRDHCRRVDGIEADVSKAEDNDRDNDFDNDGDNDVTAHRSRITDHRSRGPFRVRCHAAQAPALRVDVRCSSPRRPFSRAFRRPAAAGTVRNRSSGSARPVPEAARG